MIDTIVLALTPDLYTINNPDKFQPSAQWALQKPSFSMRGIVSKQTPTRNDLRRGIYQPRLTLSNRFIGTGRQIMLKVEVSLPKLLFGNNFNELQYKNFKAIVDKLALVLNDMGITISTANLAKAPVAAMHYSKNILLEDGSTPYHYIQKIKDANIQLSLDVNQTNYRNDGHSYKWHSLGYEVAFYDKIKDLEQAKVSPKKALEKDSDLQLDLFKSLRGKRKLEVLRMEVRLNKRDKMKRLFKKLKIDNDLTFKKLFKPAISKQILLHYVDELEAKRPALVNYKNAHGLARLADIVYNNRDLSPIRVFAMFGVAKALEEATPRELRGLFRGYNDRGWFRLMASAKSLQLPVAQSPFKVIRDQLKKFKPISGF